ncbi:hypothetical protein BOSEA31B_11257 [Hyphomicrobiales bacterium]|nr:hypothetical protein BOSEA31B_11257 [Hyphomicrobiales bacterium]CAH1697049.1 hypothetical protein BOSEA1005_10086 [Hyphomicrobiales bacterium]CAI0344987.1 hypothetical protein BO1005MUT1_350354 [Hyphomicrobiales bacterium]
MAAKPHRLTLARKDWLDAIAFGATHFKAYPHQLVTLESEGRNLLFVTRNGEFPIAAAGTWPTPVKLRATDLRSRPWDFLPDAPLTLTFDGARITIGTVDRTIAVPAKPG